MSEEIIVGTLGGGALVAYKALKPIVGPATKILVGRFQSWLEYRAENAFRIAEKANRRTPHPEIEDPAVHPRVVNDVFEEGSWIDNELQQEYLASLLVAAQSPGGVDDSMSYYIRIATSMTSQQTVLHNAIYSALAHSGLQEGKNIGKDTDAHAYAIKAPLTDVLALMGHGFTVPGIVAMGEALHGLNRENLIGSFEQMKYSIDGSDQTIYFTATPSPLGAMLYLRARGGSGPVQSLLDPNTPLESFDPEPPKLNAAVGPLPQMSNEPVLPTPPEPADGH